MANISEKKISNPERIRRIIGILRLDGREIEVHFPNYIEAGKITENTKESFTVKLPPSILDFENENLEWVYVNFVFSGVELFSKCPFIKQERIYLTLGYPESLESRTKRRYPRVKIGGKLDAKLQYLFYPDSGIKEISSKDLPIKYSKLYWEVQRENIDIRRIFLLIGREVKKISEFSEIILYNKENINSIDSYIMRKSGKTLFIENCRDIKSYTRLIPSDKIINYSYYINDKRLEGTPQQELIEELKNIIRDDLGKNYSSKVLVPFFSKGQVIGHIKVYRKNPIEHITYDEINDLMVLSNLLTIAINKVGFVPKIDEGILTKLIDISEGGLLLKVVNHEKDIQLPEGTRLEIKLYLGEKELPLVGDILRKDDENRSYAIRFEELSPEVREEIKKFIEENIDKEKKSN